MSPAADRDLAALRAAIDGGDPEAMLRLASALAQRGDTEPAFALRKRAAIEGHAPAQTALARMLLRGDGCLADPRTAVYWLRRAEASGDAEASYHLAFVSLGGVAMPRDGRINERVLAAVQGDFPLALRAAAIHFGRKRHEVDQSACVRLLERVTNYGDAIAAQLLAERLVRGEGCPANAEAAHRIQRRLIELGVPGLPAIAIAPAEQETKEMPPGTIALEDILHAQSAQTLSDTPRVMQIDGLLSADECRFLIALANANSEGDARSVDVAGEDLAVRLIEVRMARSARMELAQAEPLLLSRFDAAAPYLPGPGDTAADDANERVRTIHVFLNAVEGGGGIAFAASGPIAAVAGRAIVADTEPENDYAALKPAADAERKWLATLRFRRRRHRNF
ncbi:MAG TPA: tetratricopeptide repeat protein [Luteimonas sp.]|nr:tetratricopeptide repeat protein [Luteimonas sp.]